MFVTVKPVYRTIVKKNEKQGKKHFDVLICHHAVLVDESTKANTYRRARECPECRKEVQRYVDSQKRTKRAA